MGRATSGVQGMRFNGDDELLSLNVVREGTFLLVATSGGYSKRTGMEDYPVQGRGGKGVLTAVGYVNGEIESALQSQPGIKQCAVLVREVHGEKRLVAYLVATAADVLDVDAIKRQLAHKLPDYMVPSHYVLLDALPLTTNGKLNRRALPEPEVSAGDRLYRAPTTMTERLLCDLYAQLTGMNPVSVDDHFFSIGGHSLLAMKLIARVREVTGCDLGLRSLFEHPTPAGLAEVIDALEADRSHALLPGLGRIDEDHVVLSYGQQRMWTLDQLEPGKASYNMPLAVRMQGVLDTQALDRSLCALVARHETAMLDAVAMIGTWRVGQYGLVDLQGGIDGRIARLLIERVTVRAEGLAVDLRTEGLGSVIREMVTPKQELAA